MTLSEIERGLKAISWGELGRRAVIEDSTGRGYIVTIGTPAGEHSGVITQIFNDRLVIQQEIWDRKAKKRFPQDFTIKLSKKTDNQVTLMDAGPGGLIHSMKWNRASQVSDGSDYLFLMSETSSITAPVEMAASATLKAGQCQFPT